MATPPRTSNLSAPLAPPWGATDRGGMYLPSDEPSRAQLARGADRAGGMSYMPSDEPSRTQQSRGTDRAGGMYLPSDDLRRGAAQVPPRGTTEHGMSASLPYDDGSRQPLPMRGNEQGKPLLPYDNSRPLLSRGNEHGVIWPSDPLRSRGSERGGIFLTSDDQALVRQVENFHSPDARNVNVRPLFVLVQEIIERATQNVEGVSLSIGPKREAKEEKIALNSLQDVPELPLIVERISSEITCKLLGGVDAHSTTLSVLNMLQHFSWEAKVVLTMAAFALNYGDFWLLVQIYTTNHLAKSMAIIKRLPTVVEHAGGFKQQFQATNNLISAMFETTRCIVEFGELPSAYISTDDPEVKDAMSHFPIAVYWIIRSSVAASAHIATISSRGAEYATATTESWELSNWAHKLKNISDHLRNTLSRLYQLIGEKRDIDAYNMIKRIVYETIHVDNMRVLNALISDDEAPLYDGSAKRRAHLEVLRSKNVLLLVSDLNITQEELAILEQSYTESKVHAYEIVWIPIIDHSVQWTDMMQVKLENLQASMPWYSVHQPSMIKNAVIKFIREDWHFRGRPILVVLDPQGRVLSPNAIHMMWIWQSDAFPFTSIREQNLWEQETWRLELLVNGIDTKVLDWIREGKYIFVFGGDDIEWIRKFTREAHAVARALQVTVEMVYVGRSHNKELVRKVTEAIIVEQLSHCWQDQTMVWYFWTRIESMIFSKFQLEKVHNHADIILQEIQRLHSHDKSHSGWAILAKGSHIVVHGHGRIALNTLQELEEWKEKAYKEGFDEGFRAHYRTLHQKQFPCHRIEFPASVKVPKHMLCPDCRRPMQNCKSFICCHEDGILGSDQIPPIVLPYEG